MNSREITRDIRHAIAEAFAAECAEWTGWHDNAVDGPIERNVRPLVEERDRLLWLVEKTERDQEGRAARLMAVCETLHTLLDEGCTLRAETIHEGRTMLALLYDAMEGPLEDQQRHGAALGQQDQKTQKE